MTGFCPSLFLRYFLGESFKLTLTKFIVLFPNLLITHLCEDMWTLLHILSQGTKIKGIFSFIIYHF